MDRRQFLAISSLSATVTSAQASSGLPAEAPEDPADALFQRVDFVSDGLGLDPCEYATLLHRASQRQAITADNYSIGGCVADVERLFAKRLGKEAAVFLATGTLANHLAIRTLAGNNRRVLVQSESHLYNDSGDCAQTLSGLNLIPLTNLRDEIKLVDVQRWIAESAMGRVPLKIGVISIETPMRRTDHQYADFEELTKISRYAREQGIRLHLDGARLFNLPLHTGQSVQAYAALFDTVYVSLWKHFNGMSGAILAGDRRHIEALPNMRRTFGGSLPQAWPQIALVAQYLEDYEAQYARAWQAADQLIALLDSHAAFKVKKLAKGTSKFFLSITGVNVKLFAERLSRTGVVIKPGLNSGEVAMQVNSTILRKSVASMAQSLIDATKA